MRLPAMKILFRLAASIICMAVAADAVAQSVGVSGQIPFLPEDLAPPPSPEAGELTKYVDSNVDYSSGVLSMSVPLFSWSSG